MKTPEPDVLVERHESIFLFHPVSSVAVDWIEEHTPPNSMHYGRALVVEHRYAWDLAVGMIEDGLVVE